MYKLLESIEIRVSWEDRVEATDRTAYLDAKSKGGAINLARLRNTARSLIFLQIVHYNLVTRPHGGSYNPIKPLKIKPSVDTAYLRLGTTMINSFGANRGERSVHVSILAPSG